MTASSRRRGTTRLRATARFASPRSLTTSYDSFGLGFTRIGRSKRSQLFPGARKMILQGLRTCGRGFVRYAAKLPAIWMTFSSIRKTAAAELPMRFLKQHERWASNTVGASSGGPLRTTTIGPGQRMSALPPVPAGSRMKWTSKSEDQVAHDGWLRKERMVTGVEFDDRVRAGSEIALQLGRSATVIDAEEIGRRDLLPSR